MGSLLLDSNHAKPVGSYLVDRAGQLTDQGTRKVGMLQSLTGEQQLQREMGR